jgi:proteasome lid subunit RPN8/RPN11
VSLRISQRILDKIHAHAEATYPEEGAGFLLGADGDERVVKDALELQNSRERDARHNRYLIGPDQYRRAEIEADQRALEVIGIFHSHPDHRDEPSEFDREWAQPVFSYVITSVTSGKAGASRSWRLAEDRSRFLEEGLKITE